MTDRIEAALAALDKVTPGPWSVIYGTGDDYSEVIANFNRLFVADVETKDDAPLIAAAPDLAAEVIRLRAEVSALTEKIVTHKSWQREMVLLIKRLGLTDGRHVYTSELEANRGDRLIAEAEGE